MNANHNSLLIVFDAAGCAPVSMDTATELAAAMQASIQVLYIEDNNLLNALELPFTREVSLHTAAVSNLDPALMLQRFRTDAENIKQQIQKIAFSHRVSFSYRSVRGHKIQVIRNRTDEVNMVLVPAVYAAGRSKHAQHLKPGVVIVYESMNASIDKALGIALNQAMKRHQPLTVILDDPGSRQHIEQLAASGVMHMDFYHADITNAAETIPLLYQQAPGLLVLAEGSQLLNDERVLQQIIDTLETDLLLIS